MSELQLSLIALGAAGVAGVFAYNKWQERKHRKVAERVFGSQHADALLGGEGAETAVVAEATGTERVEPSIGGESATRPAARAVAAAPFATSAPPQAWVDPAVDCVVRFESAELIGAGYLWQAQQQALGKMTRPVTWLGFDETAGHWERLTAHSACDCRRLCAALQLADRRGPVADAELTLFFNGMQRLADEFLAVADIPPRGESLARAADIDAFCAGVDIQIGVNVIAAGGVFAGTRLRGLAEAAGLDLREDGTFHATDEAGTTLFTLANLEPALFAADELSVLTTQGVTFTLDVPRVAAGVAAFDRMIALAQQFAAGLGGLLVDDNRAPLADGALAVIRDKIGEIGQTMAARGLPAGGPQALRLFS